MSGRVLGRAVRAAVFLALAVTAFVMAAQNMDGIRLGMPRTASVYNASGVGVTLEQAMSLENSSGGPESGAVSAPTQLSALASSPGSTALSVTAIYASPGALTLLPITFVAGYVYNGDERAAVVPATLAMGLGVSAGDQIICDGLPYTVSGMYGEDASAAASIAGDGLPRVYLYDEGLFAETPASEILLTNDQGAGARQLVRTAMQLLKIPLSGGLRDYRQQIGLAVGLMQLAGLLCSFFSAAILLWYAGKHIVRAVELSGEQPIRRILRGSIAVVVAVGIFVGLSFQMGALKVPGTYLPPDNIFDFSYYSSSATAFLRELRAAPNYYEWFYASRLVAMLLWSALGVVFFIAAALTLQRFIRELMNGASNRMNHATSR